MKVSVIIINYNTFQLTCNCIESVIANTKGVAYEIILVDNASIERPPQSFKERFPDVILVESIVNGGFAKGNNWGIEVASGDIILLLNSDTYLTEDSISIAAQELNKNKSIGALGVRMVYPSNEVQFTARKFKSIRWELLDLFRFIPMVLSEKNRTILLLGKYFMGDFSLNCDWVNGAFFMFRKELLQKLAGKKLDERFFMYGEDQLWCHQFTQIGFPSYFLSTTTIVHINNGSTDKNKQLKLILTIIKRELAIVMERKGKGLHYYLFCLLYLSKEYVRYGIKYLSFRMSGKLIR